MYIKRKKSKSKYKKTDFKYSLKVQKLCEEPA